MVLFTEFGPKFDLLVENFPNLFQLLLFLSFLLLELFFMEVIAKLLNLSPFVLADIRWYILYYSILLLACDALAWLLCAAYTTCVPLAHFWQSCRGLVGTIA